ncbi:MAG: NADP-dependent oxidoreductase, partial [Pelagibacterales bacterium]|nr:NADP-dependent oxidoreductase [Pelagibacterales bacterium]
MTKNKQILMKTRPVGMPKLENFDIIESNIPEARHGEVLIKILWLSLDPYMRGRMSKAKSYAASLNEGDLILGGAVGKVINSHTPEYKEGDIVEGFSLGWQEYAIANPASIRKINPNLAPIQTAVGVLGMPGMTAFFGLLHIGKPIPGDTVVVSAASGAVGQLVGQIAKIGGCHVVGIAGGKEKCDYLINTLNFDAAIDYKNEN